MFLVRFYDALSATGHNLDKYFYSTYELEKKRR